MEVLLITQNTMASKIQRLVVCRQARAVLLQKFHHRFVKAKVGRWFQYVDTKTGIYYPQKPKVLGSLDLALPDNTGCWKKVRDLNADESYYLNCITGSRSALGPTEAAKTIQVYSVK